MKLLASLILDIYCPKRNQGLVETDLHRMGSGVAAEPQNHHLCSTGFYLLLFKMPNLHMYTGISTSILVDQEISQARYGGSLQSFWTVSCRGI